MLEGGHEDVASNRMVRKDSLKKTPTAELPSQFGFVGGGKGQKEKERENPPSRLPAQHGAQSHDQITTRAEVKSQMPVYTVNLLFWALVSLQQ